MIDFIYFIIKIFFSIVLGYLIGADYSKNSNSNKDENAIYTSIFTFVSTAFISVLYDLGNPNIGFVAIIFLGFIYFIESTTRKYKIDYRLKLFFALITGITLGLGYVLSSIIIVVIFTYIINNSNVITKLFKRKIDTSTIDIDENENLNIEDYDIEDY